MNEKGLVMGIHFVNRTPNQEGFLATTISRMVLDQCATTYEAVDLIKQVPHSLCYNFSITDRNHHQVIVEAAPTHQSIRSSQELICTNQFETEKLSSLNRIYTNSAKRKQYLQEIHPQLTDPLEAYNQFNNESSPLFFHDYENFFGTLHTVVYCPDTLEVIVGVGGNCKPLQFSLQDWLFGKAELPDRIIGRINFT